MGADGRARALMRILILGALCVPACVERSTAEHPPRAWLALLACSNEQALAERLAERLVCVDRAATEAGVRPDGCLVVPAAWFVASRTDPQLARRLVARMAHLTLHASGFALPDDAARKDCPAWVAETLAAEREALAVEMRIRRTLAVPMAPGEAEDHLAALAAAYGARCREAHAAP